MLPGFLRAGFILVGFTTSLGLAQVTTTPVEGLRENAPRLQALIHARLVVAPGKTLENATLVIKDGVIQAVGEKVEPPADARVWDFSGKTIYPGLTDSYSRLGLPKNWQPAPDRPSKKKDGEPDDAPEPPPAGGAAHWNRKVTPERSAAEVLNLDEDDAKTARSLGFTSAWIVPGRGIFRGSSALINLGAGNASKVLLQAAVAQHVAFELNDDDGGYPNSLMGCIALIRQTLLDAQWQSQQSASYEKTPAQSERPAANRSLDALAPAVTGKQSIVLETGDELDLLRMDKIAAEFDLHPILLGNGYEYRVLRGLAKAPAPLILPLAFPEVPEIETAGKALDVSLAALEHWDQAPGNPAAVAAAKVPFAFTTAGLKDPTKTFWPNLRLAVKRGLSKDIALAALTTEPAEMTHTSDRLGTLDVGKIANLTVASGDLFTDEDATVLSVWIDGKNYDAPPLRQIDLRGTWKLTFNAPTIAGSDVVFEGKAAAPEAKINGETLTITTDEKHLVILGKNQAFGLGGAGIVRLNGLVDGNLARGTAQLADGTLVAWELAKTAAFVPKPKEEKPSPREKAEDLPIVYPAGEYGRTQPPEQRVVFIHDASLWTSGPEGRIDKGDLLIENGKISQIGNDLTAPAGAVIVEAEGRHVTPGIVDAHSHTAINRGVNESSSAVTCEVRVGDVIDSTDIAIYHQLAGGVTTINQLHGSANPMGGQNSVLKLRWGGFPEDLKLAGAMPGVKFALGENVKQANWGDKFTTRYPQTRMGVYQIMRDTFLAARDYEKALALGKQGGSPVRRDLRLEAVLEILNNQRLVHIHSYRQDEVLAFIRLAQEFKFTVATFQHILEGYKVADEIAKLPAGGSSFADWWGYKFEVYDAIPTNGAIMHEAGVLTSFNSDSNELARRLNVDAAKAVKYGGLGEEEALKFVTYNPAKQLRLEARIGSLEVGKDADFVLWSGSPLSTYSHAVQTWIEGRKYFDFDEDKVAQQDVNRLRERLIQKALPERMKALGGGGGGESDDKGKSDEKDDAEPSFHELLATQRRLHWWTEYRSLYGNGGDKHNCTNLAHQWK